MLYFTFTFELQSSLCLSGIKRCAREWVQYPVISTDSSSYPVARLPGTFCRIHDMYSSGVADGTVTDVSLSDRHACSTRLQRNSGIRRSQRRSAFERKASTLSNDYEPGVSGMFPRIDSFHRECLVSSSTDAHAQTMRRDEHAQTTSSAIQRSSLSSANASKLLNLPKLVLRDIKPEYFDVRDEYDFNHKIRLPKLECGNACANSSEYIAPTSSYQLFTPKSRLESRDTKRRRKTSTNQSSMDCT